MKEGFSPRSDRLVLLFGAYAFIDGIFAVYVGMRVRGDGGRWWMMIPGGLVGIDSAGIGRIRIVDHDTIKLSNLNRQVLYTNDDLGKRKSGCARERLKRSNPNIEVEAFSETINKKNIDELVADFDLIVDALDNFPTRYLLNRAAHVKNIPLFHGAVEGFYGQATTIIPGQTACLKSIFPIAPTPSAFPIIGSFCSIIGCIQATEVVKYINRIGKLLENKLLMLDGLNSTIEEIEVQKNPCVKIVERCRSHFEDKSKILRIFQRGFSGKGWGGRAQKREQYEGPFKSLV